MNVVNEYGNVIKQMKNGDCVLKVTGYNIKNQPKDRLACHSAQEIAYFTSGKGVYFIDGKLYDIVPGTIFFILGGKNHFVKELRENIDFINIWFKPEEFAGGEGRARMCADMFSNAEVKNCRIVPGEEYYDEIKSTIVAIYDEAKGERDSRIWMIETLMCRLIILISRRFGMCAGDIGKVDNENGFSFEQSIIYINDRITKDFTLKEIADIAGVNRNYYCRIFKKYTGKTVRNYINNRRVEIAKERLRSTNDTVIDIAIACGFNSITNFNKVFKRLAGMTPSEYRAQANRK